MELTVKSLGARFSLSGLCLCTCLISSQWTLTEASESQKNGTHSERYPLVVFDFSRVELPFVICVWILLACLAKIGFHLYNKLPTIVPESCLLIVLGLVLGSLLHFTHVATTSEYVLDANVFFIYLLPPIIFDAGYFMPIRSFFDNIGSILLLAVVNTSINTACIGLSLYAVSSWGWIGQEIPLLHCFIFSALISAVDPVAVISVFEEVHVNQMLYIIVFGESLLNDGVTVVLYHMMEGFIEIGNENIIPIDVATGIGSFFIIALGGTLIGILYGLFGGFITKYTEHVKVVEPLFVFVLGYLMYLTSEMMHLSGILALSFGGIVLRHYIEHNLSKTTASTVKYFMKMLANISDTIIFMFLGLSTIVDTLDWNMAFIFFALFFCLIFRVIGVVILAWCLNRRRVVKLTAIDQFIMAFGGLRGGIAFCLALSLEEDLVPEKQLFVTATIIIVFFTVFVQGIAVKPVVNALKVKRQSTHEASLNEKIHETMLDHLMAGIEDVTSRTSHNLLRNKFRRFNHKFLQPLLTRDKVKVKATKLMSTYHSITEKDALKEASASQSQIRGSSADLYDDHKRALIRHRQVSRPAEDEDSIVFQALHASKPSSKWHMNRRHIVADSSESLNRVVYHRRPDNRKSHDSRRSHEVRRSRELQPPGFNGDIKREESTTSLSSNSEYAGVTINFTATTTCKDNTTIDSSPMTTNNDNSPKEETMAEKTLPWMENSDNPSPTHLADSIPNNEPVIAHVPTWVNNLSYSHITETGSPYVSPQATVIPYSVDYHKPIFSLFPPKDADPPDNPVQSTFSNCDYFPTPWAHNGTTDDDECPQVSHMLSEKTGERSGDFLHSTHTEKAPEHHHVIIPTNQGSDHSSNVHNNTHLSEVASAPDIHHWKPLAKSLYTELARLQSDSMLEEMAYQEGVKNRVQKWLRQTSVDDENDADEEDEGKDNDNAFDNIRLKQVLEEELDREMNEKK